MLTGCHFVKSALYFAHASQLYPVQWPSSCCCLAAVVMSADLACTEATSLTAACIRPAQRRSLPDHRCKSPDA